MKKFWKILVGFINLSYNLLNALSEVKRQSQAATDVPSLTQELVESGPQDTSQGLQQTSLSETPKRTSKRRKSSKKRCNTTNARFMATEDGYTLV